MSLEPGMKTRLATILILLLVLVSGAVLGVAVDHSLEARAAASPSESRAGASRRSGEARAEEEGQSSGRRRLIVEQVDLNDVQRAQVDSIFTHYRQEMRALQDELQTELQAAFTPRYRGLVEETRDRIKEVLTPEQRVVYDSLLAEHDKRRAEQRRERDSISGSK
jgi:Spy/CpxP family protein refolding chaperone